MKVTKDLIAVRGLHARGIAGHHPHHGHVGRRGVSQGAGGDGGHVGVSILDDGRLQAVRCVREVSLDLEHV